MGSLAVRFVQLWLWVLLVERWLVGRKLLAWGCCCGGDSTCLAGRLVTGRVVAVHVVEQASCQCNWCWRRPRVLGQVGGGLGEGEVQFSAQHICGDKGCQHSFLLGPKFFDRITQLPEKLVSFSDLASR